MTTDPTRPTDPPGAAQDPPEFKVLTEIGIIAHLADNLLASVLPDGLSTAQFAILNHLVRLERRETISELASAMQVAQPTMSSTIRRLQAAELVRLEVDPRDRRVRFVTLTPSGREMRQHALAAITPLREHYAGLIRGETWSDLLAPLREVRAALDANRPTSGARKNPD